MTSANPTYRLALLCLLGVSCVMLAQSESANAIGPAIRTFTTPVFTPPGHPTVTARRNFVATRNAWVNQPATTHGVRLYGIQPFHPMVSYGIHNFRRPATVTRSLPYTPMQPVRVTPRPEQDSAPPPAVLTTTTTTPKITASPLVRVETFVDATKLKGTTVGTDSKEIYVQLLGVRTNGEPAQQAKAYLNDLLTGEYVVLQFDQLNSSADDDGPARALVYSSKLRGSVNVDLVRRGYAVTDTRTPFADQQLFLAAQAHAKANQRGAWSKN